MAVVGLTEVVSRLATLTRAYLTLKAILRKDRAAPAYLLTTRLHLRLARAAKRFRCLCWYYNSSPQVWAWPEKAGSRTIRALR